MNYPLQGIKAIDCGTFHAGPGALAILADLGVEVIKIEQPGIGDPNREIAGYGNVSVGSHGRSLFFEGGNRNKKSIVLDLRSDKGREILYRLVSKCDIFESNFRTDAIERLGLNYTVLRQFNPRLIYAHVSGNGPLGPDSKRGGFDSQGQARSGLMFSMGEPDMPPVCLNFGVIDQTTAIVLSHGILTALVARERFGVGQEIETSILGSAMFAQYFNVMISQVKGLEIPRYDRKGSDPLRNYYRCKDGKWLSIQSTPGREDSWRICCQIMEHPELEHDPRFATEQRRDDNCRELISLLDGIFLTRSRDEWHSLFGQHDFISSPVNNTLDIGQDPQVRENKYIVECDHPIFGRTGMPGYPINFSEYITRSPSPAPLLGEHTEEVLRDIGGYSDRDIQKYREQGVIQA